MSFWMRFSENVSSLETYGPLACRILLHQTFISGEQQNLQCIVIAHSRLSAQRLSERTVFKGILVY
jgi:hypothetical protein